MPQTRGEQKVQFRPHPRKMSSYDPIQPPPGLEGQCVDIRRISDILLRFGDGCWVVGMILAAIAKHYDHFYV